MTATINEFQGPYRWLSNFYPAPVEVGLFTFPSVEHAYQAQKFWSEHWPAFQSGTAGQAKKNGRRKDWKKRADWDAVKLEVMLNLLREKFKHFYLAGKLRATGDAELIEGNYWNDTFWGVCRGVGENHLGRLLMQVRDEIRG